MRVYAIDPSLASQVETAGVNEATLKIRWERRLRPGPIGEYLHVVHPRDEDARPDPDDPVDLNDPTILHEHGLPPSEGSRKFRQQMVYAVVMSTIQEFERALGRPVMWAPRRSRIDGVWKTEFVRRLRVYPEGLPGQANAQYSSESCQLKFGWVSPQDVATGLAPGSRVYTCLAHDVIVHETTHAILDGMHHRYLEGSNADVLAFHEAFADAVALFRRLSLTELVRHQVASSRGDLEARNLLFGIARQFSQTLELGKKQDALRNALGEFDERTKQWKLPDPHALETTFEEHDRGAILLGAIFDAYLVIYRNRIRDLKRIASQGTGKLAEGELHPDLVTRLSEEACKAAGHVLRMCIRALDYCPPVDVTFGDFLRALITADCDAVADDYRNYRLAFIEAFQRRRIFPKWVQGLSVESLVWNDPGEIVSASAAAALESTLVSEVRLLLARWNPRSSRKRIFDQSSRLRAKLHEWLAGLREHYHTFLRERDGVGGPSPLEQLTGLALGPDAPWSIRRDRRGRPVFEVHAAWPTRRVGPDGDLQSDLVVIVTQRRSGYLDPERQTRADAEPGFCDEFPEDFPFRGGCTMILDLETARPRYVIRKDVLSAERLDQQRQRLAGRGAGAAAHLE